MAKKRSVRIEETENKARAIIQRVLAQSMPDGDRWEPWMPSLESNKPFDSTDMERANSLFDVMNRHFAKGQPYGDNKMYRVMAANILEHSVPPSPWRDYILCMLRNF